MQTRVYIHRVLHLRGTVMAKNERRKTMPLDEVYVYFRRLELKLERPSLFKVCNAIKTMDLALESDEETSSTAGHTRHLSPDAWSKIRDQLFHILITNFSGYFLVYPKDQYSAVDSGGHWPESGYIEFYPEKILRRFETYRADFEDLQPQVINCLRWCFGQDRQNITPSLFSNAPEPVDADSEASEAMKFLDRLYEICEEEASQGKKIAHRRWWQLYWEANGCVDRRQRHELQKKMLSLQSVWGRPAQLV